MKRHPKDRGFGYKKSYNYEQSIKEKETDQASWRQLKKKLPQLLKEGLIFGIFATTFLTGIAIALYHLLSCIKSF